MHTNRRTWRMIVMTGAVALLCWGASLVMLRAVAQDAQYKTNNELSVPPTNEAEEIQRRSNPPTTADNESPPFKYSADNSIEKMPIDI